MKQDIRPLRTAGILLGVGLGGFVDGILLHQILQLHNMLSAQYFPDTLANEQINMFWDGIFHAFTWLVTAAGLWKLWRVAQRGESPLQTNVFLGSMLLGWGLFNLIEGILDHQVLGLHNVVQRAAPGAQLFWDLSFLAVGGLGLIALGLWQIRRGKSKLAVRNFTRDWGDRTVA